MRTISQTCSESKPEEEEHFTSKGLTEAVLENAGLDSDRVILAWHLCGSLFIALVLANCLRCLRVYVPCVSELRQDENHFTDLFREEA